MVKCYLSLLPRGFGGAEVIGGLTNSLMRSAKYLFLEGSVRVFNGLCTSVIHSIVQSLSCCGVMVRRSLSTDLPVIFVQA